jgi:hypothetical protein
MLIGVALDFSEQVKWSQSTFGWIPSFRKKQKLVRLLGPLALVKELGEKVWCTIKLQPVSATQTQVKCDIYDGEGFACQKVNIDALKQLVIKEVEAVQAASPSDFAYECGGMSLPG